MLFLSFYLYAFSADVMYLDFHHDPALSPTGLCLSIPRKNFANGPHKSEW